MSQVTYANIYDQLRRDADAHARFERSLADRRNTAPPVLAHHIGGQDVTSGHPFDKHDPAQTSRVLARAFVADADLVARAVTHARRAQREWAASTPAARAAVVASLGSLLEERADEIAAVIASEVGKPRADSAVEITESIVIVEQTVRDYLRADGFTVPMPSPGDDATTELSYRPYGVFGAIAPFNFPVAISLTMLAGALITGNSVVFKPSALTPLSGELVYDLCVSAGVPRGVINLVHGDGSTGAALADSSVDGIVFTGSAEVGLGLLAKLSQPPYARPVIAEMGGKNPAIISDRTSDLQVAARAVARSAFGMTGQKCTACSRVIVVDGVYDEFVSLLVEEAQKVTYADPSEPSAFAGPLINNAALSRFEAAVEQARSDGRVLVGGAASAQVGNFVEATVVDSLPLGHPLTRNELFAPFLTVTRVPDFEAAIVEANAIQFGLSAGLFSSDEGEKERFLNEIEAGIVIINNAGGATTGVWPAYQTMSGWKASGTTGKGGFGPYYIQQFVREQSRIAYS